jgi:hypothetical protein
MEVVLTPEIWLPTRDGVEVIWDRLGKLERKLVDKYFELPSLKDRSC